MNEDDPSKYLHAHMLDAVNDIDVQKSYHNGAKSYIVKPVDFEKFLHAIKEIQMYWLVSNQLPS